MPVYEYYCQKCTTKFELLRPIARADEAATCPKGHSGGTRTLSVFAAVSKGADGAPQPMLGGGCACGGGGLRDAPTIGLFLPGYPIPLRHLRGLTPRASMLTEILLT